MGIAAPRILVVDDKPEHGEAIVRKLWQLGYASLFVQYDPALLTERVYGPYRGVRLVFMDLDLKGTGRIGEGSTAYAEVAATLKEILDEDNGPWILVTWTGHADHADVLYTYLKDPRRLPKALHPASNAVLDKEDFIHDDGTYKNDSLLSKLRELTDQENATGCLLGWEAGVWESANQVVAELSRTASHLEGDNIHQSLGHLLHELAKADAGESMDDNPEFASFLYRVLTSLLSDKLSILTPDTNNPCNKEIIAPAQARQGLESWKREINTMLHFEGAYSAGSCPGALFQIRDETMLPHPVQGDPQNFHNLIEREFLFPKGADERQMELVQRCSLHLIDITPPCDHSQKKIRWRRFALVCKTPLEGLSNSLKKKLKKTDYLKMTPEFRINGQDCIFLINANLQTSLHDDEITERLGNAGGRIKEQLMADILGWIGRHITRLGHVYLSTP